MNFGLKSWDFVQSSTVVIHLSMENFISRAIKSCALLLDLGRGRDRLLTLKQIAILWQELARGICFDLVRLTKNWLQRYVIRAILPVPYMLNTYTRHVALVPPDVTDINYYVTK